jgi:hypothetical protein
MTRAIVAGFDPVDESYNRTVARKPVHRLLTLIANAASISAS